MPMFSYAGPYGRENPTSHISLYVSLGGKNDDCNLLNYDTVQCRR
jgi:hypothetical protein